MDHLALPAPVSATVALKAATLDIEVPDGTVETIGPFETRYSDAFRIAEVKSFSDLQTLGFVHRDVREETAVQAVRADDRAFRAALAEHAVGCTCEGRASGQGALARRHFQDHLLDELQSVFPSALAPDDSAVLHTYYHVKAWVTRPSRYLVGLVALRDISIGDRATLIATPAVRGLYANNISIGREGHLRFTSGAVKVTCKVLNGAPRPGFEPFDPSAFAFRSLPGITRELARRKP